MITITNKTATIEIYDSDVLIKSIDKDALLIEKKLSERIDFISGGELIYSVFYDNIDSSIR